ncbi:MAG: peptidylprolyl isomerase [Planctomycetes bacterium]|nr:peptidylprolyl isomerase [Planctomycetota bacterium]
MSVAPWNRLLVLAFLMALAGGELRAEDPFLPPEPALSGESLVARVAELSEELLSPDWPAREAARRALLQLGRESLGPLVRLREEAGAELATALEALIATAREEVRVRHILVTDRAEAERIQANLANGADFEYLAESYSKARSASRGGDLGFIRRGQTVPAFEAAAFALEPGDPARVVETGAGFHIVVAVEKRVAELPLLAGADEAAGGERARLVRALEDLSSDSWDEREAATKLLEERGVPVADEVKRLAESDDLEVRSRAERIWTALEWRVLVPDEVERELPGLRGGLASADPSARQGALARLRESRRFSDPSLAGLYEDLIWDPDPNAAAIGIAGLARSAGEEAIPNLERRLESGDEKLRMLALEALVRMAPRRAIEFFGKALAVPSDAIRSHALEELANIDGESLLPEELADRVAPCLDSAGPSQRFLTVQVLARIPGPKSAAAIAKAFGDPDTQVYELAAQWLLEHPSHDSTEVIAAGLGSSDVTRRFYAVQLLAKLGGPRAKRALVPALFDSQGRIREKARAELGTEGLVLALSHADELLRRAALDELLQERPDGGSDVHAWEAWWIDSHRPQVREAMAALSLDIPARRFEAARALQDPPFVTVIEALEAHREDPVPWVREEVARVLGSLREE